MSSRQFAIKAVVERVLAVIALIVLSPVLAATALAIKVLDPGPVLFRQPRLGLDGAEFVVWKFRTMIVDADKFIDADGRPTRARVTRLGGLLRKSSIDELPQLVNVVKGDMALIGPRPVPVSHLERYTPEQMRRFRVKPGVTGLAQVSGRNELPWSKRIQLDNEYIDNYSLRLDVRLFFRTIQVALSGSGVVMDRNPGEVDDLGPPRASSG